MVLAGAHLVVRREQHRRFNPDGGLHTAAAAPDQCKFQFGPLELFADVLLPSLGREAIGRQVNVECGVLMRQDIRELGAWRSQWPCGYTARLSW